MSPERTDVAVVGAGIVGCLVAREITARAPEASVVLLDRDTVGAGASRRSAGLHCPRGATERVRHMTAYSQDYYARLKHRAPELPIHAVPMSVVASPANAARVREIYLDSAELTRIDTVTGSPAPCDPSGAPPGQDPSEQDPSGPPDLRLPEDARIWNCRGAQYADVYALVHDLARELRPRVTLREGVHVDAVRALTHASPGRDTSVSGVELTLGTGETLTADRVVLAPGPWLAEPAWRELLAPLGARVKKIVALHIERVPTRADRAVVFQDEDAFLLPLHASGHWLFSYTCTTWDVDPDDLVDGLSADDVDQARASLRRYAPELAERCVSGRVFCDAYSPTGEPQVRALGEGRVVFAGTANGSGYRLAPAIAAEAADLLDLSSIPPHAWEKQRSLS
ncbi:FAD-binding oxidoreductase (plasmid) [Embleya sp. NBC_00888]|uniref:NAD(P)/FAD-dependent oxidoreductase n=1 Tax=Embleya sp. NBC_00888 TaxID=2975960 RepID=UPI002F913589|nr:FAD-binding oxidoreductase [Embleya sp. NBC_00888]